LHRFDYQHIALITWKSYTLDEWPEGLSVLRPFYHPPIPHPLAPGCSVSKPGRFIWPPLMETFFPSGYLWLL